MEVSAWRLKGWVNNDYLSACAEEGHSRKRGQSEHMPGGVMMRAKTGVIGCNSKVKKLSLSEFNKTPPALPTRITPLVRKEPGVKTLAGVSAKPMFFPLP